MQDLAQGYMAKYERAKTIRREFEELKDVMIRYLMRRLSLAYKNLHLGYKQDLFLTLLDGLTLLQVVKCLKLNVMK